MVMSAPTAHVEVAHSNDPVAFILASSCAGLAIAISAHSISKHLRHFNAPRFQLPICRILLMVPIYASIAWMSLVFPRLDFFLGTLRDSYEAYVIYNFFTLLIAYLGGEEFLIDWLELRGHIRHPWPLNRFGRPIALGASFLRKIKQGTLQFVFIKPFTAVLAWGLAIDGLYTEGSYSLSNGFLYVSVINNVSVTVSLYCLIIFYVATKSRLEPFSPLPKFMCVKAVVFFSYWQSCVLQGLVLIGWIQSYAVSAEIQNILISVEMFVAALAHHVSFPSDEYMDHDASFKPVSAVVCVSVLNMCACVCVCFCSCSLCMSHAVYEFVVIVS
jgi:hypothetical protein